MPLERPLPIAVALLLLVSAGISLAWWAPATAPVPQQPDWVQDSIQSTTVYDLEFSPDGETLWAASGASGAFSTTNLGTSWNEKIQGMGRHGGHRIVVKPSDSSVLLAAADEGLFRTTDGGSTWATSLGTADADTVLRVAFAKSSNYIAYAGTTQGFWKSTNSGSTWTRHLDGIGPLTVTSIGVHPTSFNIVYAGTERGPYKSVDGGDFFALQIAGMESLADPVVTAMWVHQGNPEIVLLGCWDGVFRSSNAGVSWQNVSSVPQVYVYDITEVTAGSQRTFYSATQSGLYSSIDDGATWSQVRSTPCRAVACHGSNVVVAEMDGRIAVSTDGGSNWNYKSSVGAPNVRSMSSDPGVGGRVYAITEDDFDRDLRIWRRDNPGAYTPLSLPDPEARRPQVIRSSRTVAGTVLCMTEYPGVSMVFTSTNAGVNWTGVVLPFSEDSFQVLDMATSPTTSGRASAAVLPGHMSSFDNYLYVFDVSIQEWVAVSPSAAGHTKYLTGTVAIRAGSPEELWAAGSVERNYGAPGLAFKSTNGGTTWTKCGVGMLPSPVMSIDVDGAGGTTVFAGTQENGVFVSTDAGTSWVPRNAGLGDLHVHAILFDPSVAPARLYAATDSGVFWSSNLGVAWAQLGTLLSSDAVQSLAVSGGEVFAGVKGRGIWRIPRP